MDVQVKIIYGLMVIIRNTEPYSMVFDTQPPDTILTTRDLDFGTMQRLVCFARYWDLITNSGRFKHARPLTLSNVPIGHFMVLSDWLYDATDSTHRVSLTRLVKLVADWLVVECKLVKEDVANCRIRDYPGKASP